MENQCMNCGNQLQGKQKKYCSKICKKRYCYYQTIKTCRHCSKQFRRNDSPSPGACKACAECLNCGNLLKAKQLKFCSRKCSSNYCYHKNKGSYVFYKKIKQPCQVCGSDTGRKYCSDECRKAKRRVKKREFTCLNCGKVEYRMHKIKYCSAKCESQVHCRKRRARENQAFVENVYLTDLIERDDCNCKICNKPVDLSLDHPHPLSASIDHIHPISKGGEHSLANTQLAHLRCNLLKSDKII